MAFERQVLGNIFAVPCYQFEVLVTVTSDLAGVFLAILGSSRINPALVAVEKRLVANILNRMDGNAFAGRCALVDGCSPGWSLGCPLEFCLGVALGKTGLAEFFIQR